MRIATETITPREALEILARSVGQTQRNLDQRRVSLYAQQMKGGQWRVTHQAIALDDDGVLIDGQHRVNAVVKAGIPVQMMVARGADPSTFDAIDNGRPRGPANALSIAGYSNVNVLASAIRHYLVYETLAGTTRSTGPDVRALWSTHDIVETARSLTGSLIVQSIRDAHPVARSLAQAGSTTWLSACIAMLRAKGVDDVLREEFLGKLDTGVMLPAGSPIHALRRWMIAGGYANQRSDQRAFVGMAAFVKTWNGWLNSEEIRLITFRPGAERVPEIEQHRTMEPLIEIENALIAAGR